MNSKPVKHNTKKYIVFWCTKIFRQVPTDEIIIWILDNILRGRATSVYLAHANKNRPLQLSKKSQAHFPLCVRCENVARIVRREKKWPACLSYCVSRCPLSVGNVLVPSLSTVSSTGWPMSAVTSTLSHFDETEFWSRRSHYIPCNCQTDHQESFCSDTSGVQSPIPNILDPEIKIIKKVFIQYNREFVQFK